MAYARRATRTIKLDQASTSKLSDESLEVCPLQSRTAKLCTEMAERQILACRICEDLYAGLQGLTKAVAYQHRRGLKGKGVEGQWMSLLRCLRATNHLLSCFRWLAVSSPMSNDIYGW